MDQLFWALSPVPSGGRGTPLTAEGAVVEEPLLDSKFRGQGGDDPESTAFLLARARRGDGSALNELAERYLPLLTRFAHGRLPDGARDMIDTDDIVLVTIEKALSHLDGFEPRHEGAFLAYLRRTVLNQIRDEIRRATRRPTSALSTDQLVDAGRTPLERAVNRETLEDYERALTTLTPDQHEAVVLRLELGMSYPQIAQALERSSAGAARMMVARALVRLAEAMAGHRGT